MLAARAKMRARSVGLFCGTVKKVPIIVLMMPLSFSISIGIGLGFIAYVALKVLAGRFAEINAAVAVIALAFLLKLVFTLTKAHDILRLP